MFRRQILKGIIAIVCMGFMLTGLGSVTLAAPYYEGKTLTMIQGRTPGGTGDIRARTVIKYLKKHLEGKPIIVSRYMPAGGGTLAANFMAQKAKRDGLTIGNIGSSMFPNAILKSRGVRYKLDDFIFLGSPSPGNPYTLVITPKLKLTTAEEVKAHDGLRFGQRSVGHAMYILDRVIAYVLDLKHPSGSWVTAARSCRLPLKRGKWTRNRKAFRVSCAAPLNGSTKDSVFP